MSYLSVCYNEGCGGTEVFEHPQPVMWLCRDCREKQNTGGIVKDPVFPMIRPEDHHKGLAQGRAKDIAQHAECLEKATEIAQALDQKVYVQKMAAIARHGISFHHKWVIFFEPDPFFGGYCVEPNGNTYEMEQYT